MTPRLQRITTLSLTLAAAGSLLECASAPRRFAAREPLWTDTDTRPIHHAPHSYYSPLLWDGADQMVFRPVTRALWVETNHEAVNVNSVDEVPDSSWYQNRLATHEFSPAEAYEGSCAGHPMPDANGAWTILSSKPNGWFPGFVARGPDGQRYLMKADGVVQAEQTTTGDIVGSRIFWAAGYNAPCNRSIRIQAANLRLAPNAHYEDSSGHDRPMQRSQIEDVLSHARHYEDGSYRLGISLFVEGRPLGPFTYQGTRNDDPNDVIPHEDRRDLRGARLLSAWINHWDAREQNTLTSWIDTGSNTGYVRHYMIDFGDTLGSMWPIDGLNRRLGHSGYLDVGHLTSDFLTLGLIDRPWDHVHTDRDGWIFGYFTESPFDPSSWRPAYQNPAYNRMTERDAAWMARILAKFTDAHVHEIVRAANLSYAPWADALERILKARRDAILARYLTRVSSLADVAVRGNTVCASDRAIEAHLYGHARYQVEWLTDGRDDRHATLGVVANDGTRVCFQLPPRANSEYGVLRVTTSPQGRRDEQPLRVHLYAMANGSGYSLAGIER